jgi:hypothetical protein
MWAERPNVKPRLSRQERTLNFLVAEESSFPQDATSIRTGIAKRMVGILATATFRQKPWRNFHRGLGGRNIIFGPYPSSFTVPANSSKRAGMEKLAGDHRRNLLKKIRRRSKHDRRGRESQLGRDKRKLPDKLAEAQIQGSIRGKNTKTFVMTRRTNIALNEF